MATAEEKRAKLLEDLAALNVTVTGDEDDKELATKLKEAKTAAKAVEDAAATLDPITVKFRDHQGKPTERTFSKEVHGDDFAALADEFKATNATKLIK